MKLFFISFSFTILFIINNFTHGFSCEGNVNNNNLLTLCSITADVLLTIDTSNKISHNEFDNIKSKLIEFIDNLDIDINKIKIGILTFGDKIKQLHHMTSNKFEKQLIKNKINDLEQTKDAGLTTKTLNFAKLIFQMSQSQRSFLNKIPKIVILVSTGFFNENEIILIRREVNQLKMVSKLITVDALGNGLVNRNLRMIASCPNYYVRFDSLLNLLKSISAQNCASL
jgi:hypothetical protein